LCDSSRHPERETNGAPQKLHPPDSQNHSFFDELTQTSELIASSRNMNDDLKPGPMGARQSSHPVARLVIGSQYPNGNFFKPYLKF
jgi:hypothetical protein